MGQCYSGDIFQSLDSVATQIAFASMDTLGLAMVSLIGGWALVYSAWNIIQYIAGRYDAAAAPGNAIVQVMIYIIVIFILSGGAATQFWWPIFEFLKDVGPWAGSLIIAATGDGSVQGNGVEGLLCTTEHQVFDRSFALIKLMGDDIGITDKISTVAAVILLGVVFIVLVWKMIKGVVGAYMKIMAIGILSPFLVAMTADKHTRPVFVSGLKIMLSGAFELVLASAAVATVLMLMNGIYGLLGSAPREGANVAFSSEYWTLLLTGALLLLTYEILIGVASQITQVFGQSAQQAMQPISQAVQAAGFVGSMALGPTGMMVTALQQIARNTAGK